jgi:L-serine dehydratase
VFDKKHPLPGHANGMTFTAYDRDGAMLLKRVYYSIGGGFVVTDTELEALKSVKEVKTDKTVPYPFAHAKEMLEMAAPIGPVDRADEAGQ